MHGAEEQILLRALLKWTEEFGNDGADVVYNYTFADANACAGSIEAANIHGVPLIGSCGAQLEVPWESSPRMGM